MRTTTKLFLSTALAASTLGACKWTEFDDLSNETWVVSTEKPDVKSSDYGVAIQRGDFGSTSGGTLAVIGSGQTSYSELSYSATGSASVPSNNLALSLQGVVSFDPQPPFLLAAPTSAEVALVTNGDTSSIVVATGTHTLGVRQLFVNAASLTGISPTPTAATYMLPPKRTGATQTPPAEPLVASGDFVLGTFYAEAPAQQPACKLTDGGTGIGVRALGTVKNGAIDDVLAWGAGGKLYRYPGAVFNGCVTQEPLASVATTFMPAVGSQILPLDDTHVILQGHLDPRTGGEDAFLQVFRIDIAGNVIAPVGNALTAKRLRSAAVLDVDGTKYVVAGFPTEQVDGVTAGVVNVYRVSAATGLETTPVATLHDAQPEGNQSFGRSVAVMPYNGKQVIAVAANNEVFVYFRANRSDGTALYNEVRQGR